MPWYGSDNYKQRCEKVKKRKAHLRKLGIVENSSKWFKLMHRRH